VSYQSTEEVMAAVKKMAAAGKITDIPRDEAQVKDDIEKLIQELDTNKDGKIQWSEIVAAMVKAAEMPDEAGLKAAVDEAIPTDAVPQIVEQMKAEIA